VGCERGEEEMLYWRTWSGGRCERKWAMVKVVVEGWRFRRVRRERRGVVTSLENLVGSEARVRMDERSEGDVACEATRRRV
jgi:hypothetical protein